MECLLEKSFIEQRLMITPLLTQTQPILHLLHQLVYLQQLL